MVSCKVDKRRIAREVAQYLDACTSIGYSDQRALLASLATKRVISALNEGNAAALSRWYALNRDLSRDDVDDVIHAASHAVAYTFEIDDPKHLREALSTLAIIECEVMRTSAERNCDHRHPFGLAQAESMTA